MEKGREERVAQSIVDETLEKYRRYLNPSWVKGFKLAGLDTVEAEAEGTIVRDVFGREYLDFSGGYSVFILGHRHPRVVEAARRELERMPMSVRMLPSDTLADLAECMAQATPGDLQHSFFCHSGAEAVEAAIKLARAATGKPEIISTVGAYHGKTLGALSASGRELYRTPFEPLVPGFV
ncbi:MAG: aminotransferase class III-fold pyridoxal phosphate-dependent enzyme, partial [Armatimonadota bacterium]|nr:aminotransferase class III-fold pyridoxal phosphate-dependent enzyme [Armatimonadota bacterium]